MLALYLAALGFGATTILVSLLLGGGDKDLQHDHDLAHDHDHDHDHDLDKSGGFSAWWLLSLRFWTFGLAAFGLTGTLLSLLPVPGLLAAAVAASAGLGIGLGAARLFRALNRDQVSGATELGHLAGEEARVVVAIRPGVPGKIAISSLAGRVELLATSRDPGPIEAGSAVLVASVSSGVADVSRLPKIDDPARRRRALAAQTEGSGERKPV